VCEEPVDATLARTVVKLSRRLSFETIAEGVETAEQAAVRAAIGCTFAPG
jgi:EAL domain-containing protein (putative c-di-GMP-specific phosphodiesterase class I)